MAQDGVTLLMMEMTTDKTTLLRGRPIVFGVAGGTASGKTTVARAVLEAVGASQIAYPVSYTHLDVYKRQQPHRPCATEQFRPCLLYTSRCV